MLLRRSRPNLYDVDKMIFDLVCLGIIEGFIFLNDYRVTKNLCCSKDCSDFPIVNH